MLHHQWGPAFCDDCGTINRVCMICGRVECYTVTKQDNGEYVVEWRGHAKGPSVEECWRMRMAQMTQGMVSQAEAQQEAQRALSRPPNIAIPGRGVN